jgi:hypothetical protein
MHLFGFALQEEAMTLTVQGGGKWSPLSCMFSRVMTLRDAMSDYYDHASTGDLIKAHNRFAVFSADKRWVGDLTALTPGEGYLFRRMAPDAVNIRFYNSTQSSAPRRAQALSHQQSTFSNPQAATNMTMIARIEGNPSCMADQVLRVYVGSELACIATSIDSLYFLTIQSDQLGELRFEMNGEMYAPESGKINYSADAHHGSMVAPIILRPSDDRPYKIIENEHVVIIRNNEKYDVTGKKL